MLNSWEIWIKCNEYFFIDDEINLYKLQRAILSNTDKWESNIQLEGK